MKRWRLYSISLALVMGLVALAPIHMHAWDGANSEFLYIVKHLYDSDQAGEHDDQANSHGHTGDYDGAEEEYLDLTKKKPLDKSGKIASSPKIWRVNVSELFPPTNKGTSQPC
ncbi:MAG: hypothetical protein ACE5OZ_22295 [Candidatus Heimdallarchaeota archaeon]